MKTTKSILAVLFFLLAVQLASAYYCPSTGRWLSRDPVGEPGFQVLLAAAQAPIAATSSRWINRYPIADPANRVIASTTPAPNSGLFAGFHFYQGHQSQSARPALQPNLYSMLDNDPILYYDPHGLYPCTTAEHNTCTYVCKSIYPGAVTAEHCKAFDVSLFGLCFLHLYRCNCSCQCNLMLATTPYPGDPQHYNEVSYQCPGFGQIGGRWPIGVPAPPTINPPCSLLQSMTK